MLWKGKLVKKHIVKFSQCDFAPLCRTWLFQHAYIPQRGIWDGFSQDPQEDVMSEKPVKQWTLDMNKMEGFEMVVGRLNLPNGLFRSKGNS